MGFSYVYLLALFFIALYTIYNIPALTVYFTVDVPFKFAAFDYFAMFYIMEN